MDRVPKLELLWWEGCPSTARALSDLRAAAAELGLDSEVVTREIKTEAEAAAASFVGSPTILIDGADLAATPDDAAERSGWLSCRVYRRRDGRISPTPDPDDMRDALRGAAARNEVRR
ncbi:MAG: DF family (seleno)protein [Solirubrobacteraceae bacterium]